MAVAVSENERFLYTSRNESKTDAELQTYILTIAQKIQAIPANSSPVILAQAQKLLVEMTVCKEMLETRQRNQACLSDAHKKWDETLQERRYAAVQNLKEAVTPNGQLIAAILEDEGSLTEDEIATWCEELEALDDEALDALLNALVKEGVIVRQNDKYALKQICTASLFPEKPVEWAMRNLGKQGGEDEEVLLRLIEAKGTAICEEDFPVILSDAAFVSAVRKMGYPQELRCQKLDELRDRFKQPYMAETVLSGLPLDAVQIKGFRMRYFPMLGNSEVE